MRVPKGVCRMLQLAAILVVFQLLLLLNKEYITNSTHHQLVNKGVNVNQSDALLVSFVNRDVSSRVNNIVNHDVSSRVNNIVDNDVSPRANSIVNHEAEVANNKDKLTYFRQKMIPTNLKENIRVVGSPRNKTGFLTIGIPSVKRTIGPEYLMNTLASIIDQTNQVDKLRTVVVIFLCDEDAKYNEEVLSKIISRFKLFIDSGFFQIITADKSLYPNLDIQKRNYGDTLDRVHWRSKQVADFALMFKFSEHLSTYYIQIEDDILCAPQFVSLIERFIQEKNARTWALLEFTNIGFIGKLFKSKDLDRLAVFMLVFYQEQPVDWLIDYFRLTMTQKDRIIRKPGLFQHMGKKSSFAGNKDKAVKAAIFPTVSYVSNGNPPGVVVTRMKSYQNNIPENAYQYANAFFWAVDPLKNDSVTVVFDKETLISQIQVITGNKDKPNDILRLGSVYLSPVVKKLQLVNLEVECADPVKIGDIKDGKFLLDNVQQKISKPSKCLIITVNSDQKDWIIFNNIVVKT